MKLTADGFARLTHVSRETMARLEAYVGLLIAWNARINLVGRNTIGEVWLRHIHDSSQLFSTLPPRSRRLIDLGSGAGLPGLILAIIGVPDVHLVETDRKKAIFLAEAMRVTATRATLHVQRVETMKAEPFDVVTARALAPLPELLSLAEPFIGPDTVCLFHKGQGAEAELTEAAKGWNMAAERLPSVTDNSGTILKLERVSRVEHA